jgi:poly(A) polymerase Pap1
MQEIDVNKANWDALFEHFHFFEAYRKFLVVDIVAEDDDDLRLWKGWIESRLRQLTLKVPFEFLTSVHHICSYFSSLDTCIPHQQNGYFR